MKIICMANQKGGCGKTTLSIYLANYLSKDFKVLLIDADPQQSVSSMRETDQATFTDQEFSYEVEPFDLEHGDAEDLLLFIRNSKYDYVIIDMPGGLGGRNVGKILLSANTCITPFQYEKTSLHSTSNFIGTLISYTNQLGVSIKILFVPFQVRANTGKKEEKEMYQQVKDNLQNVGSVSPDVPFREELKRINTISINKQQEKDIMPYLAFVYDELQK